MGGLLAIVSDKECSKYIRRGLIASRHQGNDYFGVCAVDSGGMLVGPKHQEGPSGTEFFKPSFKEVCGHIVLSSVSSHDKEPIVGRYKGKDFALAINGRVLNLDYLKREILGSSFEPAGFSHAQVMGNLIGQKSTLVDGIKYAWERTEGTQDVLLLYDNRLLVARHPEAVLPLLIGKNRKGELAAGSSDFVLRKLDFKEDLFSLNGGDIYSIRNDEIRLLSEGSFSGNNTCAFLWTYSGHLDDEIEGFFAAELRERLGRALFRADDYIKDKVKNGEIDPRDVVVSPILMSGLGASVGYHLQALDEGFRFCSMPVFIPSQRYKRSYVPETDEERRAVANFKLDEIRYYIKDKFVILVDDSIVRGTQTEARVSLVRENNPRGLVVRASHPKIWFPCSYKLSTQSTDELAAHKYGSNDAIAAEIGAEHVAFNSFEDYAASFPEEFRHRLCFDCAKRNE